ncbi:nucleotidyltransferase family protein [bacterium]|nr:nucleotidyltransferase family protein [bacterium]
MKSFEEIKNILSHYKKELKIKYGVKEIGIFGSYVRNEQGQSSDIDILVEFEKTPSLLEFINLENYLSDILGIKVDLVMKDSLKPNIGRHILEEVILV